MPTSLHSITLLLAICYREHSHNIGHKTAHRPYINAAADQPQPREGHTMSVPLLMDGKRSVYQSGQEYYGQGQNIALFTLCMDKTNALSLTPVFCNAF